MRITCKFLNLFIFILSLQIYIKEEVYCFKSSPRQRYFIFKERIYIQDIDLSDGKKDIHIWIPYPVNDRWQHINNFQIKGPFDARFIQDPKYGNKILYLTLKQSLLKEKSSKPYIYLSFEVVRKEYASGIKDNKTKKDGELQKFLGPNRLVPVNGRIKDLAIQITKDKKTTLEKVRAIYDYIIDELTYSKDDPDICGVGSSLLTLKHKKGICTDYHSLFISLVRSLGIPARFEIGYRVPEKFSGKLNGYHCWAKFYVKEKGWIPVDISEADKHPELQDYFFGHIDANRIHISTGRDIVLRYSKSGELNFFVYPYVELGGRHYTNVITEVIAQDIEGG